MRHLRIHQSVQSTRSGFTIVELMMVVGILLFLIATSVFVVRNLGNTAREKATMSTITKINGLLTQRIDALRRASGANRNQTDLERLVSFRSTKLRRSTSDSTNIGLGAGASSVSTDVLEILVAKDLFRQYFPQVRNENASIDSLMDAVAGTSGAAGNLGSDGGRSVSAEYLYYFLTQHGVYGAAPLGEDNFLSTEVVDTDGDGLKEFVDSWGRPLRFYRWPTRLIKPDGVNVDRTTAGYLISSLPAEVISGTGQRDPLTIDPDDPKGLIQLDNQNLSGLLNPLFAASDSSTPYTLPQYATRDTYSIPLIVSAGQDSILGLYEPVDATNNGYLCHPDAANFDGLFDNITNHNQRAGGN
ncbi:hypothetical protein Pan241w_52280 [Gimesia alba]|uniref:Uncharacterized protein n=1 Tax=Gimesia alba TaxID=2527973 RepID=A0A517RMK0_9PLAN|nr:hypothetical protein [Gimesia alba]QDT45110.1 hypothetical protein Pan241w_52280 [Gimesia alba]